MSPLLSDSLTILFMLAAKPDVMIKRDSVWRALGSDHQTAVNAAAPLIERAWIHRHLQGNRSMTMGYTITDAGQLAARTITERINHSL